MIYSDMIFNLLAKLDFLPLVNNQPRVTDDRYWKISSTGILQTNECFDAEVSRKYLWNCYISQQMLFTKLMNLCSRIAHIPRVLRRCPWHLHVFFVGVPSGLWLVPVCSGGSLTRSQLSRTQRPNGALLHVQTLSAPAHSLFRSRSHAPTAPLEW